MGKSVIILKVYFYNFIIFILYVIYNKIKISKSEVFLFFMKQNKTMYSDFFILAKATQWFTAGNFPISRFIRC